MESHCFSNLISVWNFFNNNFFIINNKKTELIVRFDEFLDKLLFRDGRVVLFFIREEEEEEFCRVLSVGQLKINFDQSRVNKVPGHVLTFFGQGSEMFVFYNGIKVKDFSLTFISQPPRRNS